MEVKTNGFEEVLTFTIDKKEVDSLTNIITDMCGMGSGEARVHGDTPHEIAILILMLLSFDDITILDAEYYAYKLSKILPKICSLGKLSDCIGVAVDKIGDK